MRKNKKILPILIIILSSIFTPASAQTPPETWQANEIGSFHFTGLAQHDYLNVDWIRTAIPWCLLQPDSVTWDWNRFENRIQQAMNAGVKILLTLRIGQGWMNGMPLSEEETYTLPPKDLSSIWNEQFGHSRNYYNFAYEIVKHFHPAAINIENEANANNFYRGSVDDYIRILKTAKLAADRANPGTWVLDSGFACRAWGITVAWDRYQSGNWNQQETFDFLLDYALHWADVLQNPEQLDEFFQNGQDHIEFIQNAIPLFKNNIDLLNFHNYSDYSLIDTVIVWIREKMNEAGYQAPLFCNEHGIKIDPDSFYDKQGLDQAVDMFKQVITMWAMGVDVTIRFPFDKEDTGAVGLFNHPDSLWLAAHTLRLLGNKISGRCRFSGAISSGPDVYRYAFSDSCGNDLLEAAWSESGKKDITIQMPPTVTDVLLNDVIGNTTEINALGGVLNITLNSTPLIIEFIHHQTGLDDNQVELLPLQPFLYPPNTNPFNTSTTFRFYIPRKEFIKLTIFDILGREVVTLVNEMYYSGNHSVIFNAQDLSSGVYLLKLKFETVTQVKMMELIK